jgi:isoamylase
MEPQPLLLNHPVKVELHPGHPLPLGASVRPGGVNFAIASRYATAVTLLICTPGEEGTFVEFPLDARFHRTGEVWHAFLNGIEPGICYAYRMDRVPNPEPHVHRFDPRVVLLDPYAKALAGGDTWGIPPKGRQCPRRSLVLQDEFDWGDDEPPLIRPADAIIHELHVRGFTQHPSSGVSRPGTFAGVVERIPAIPAPVSPPRKCRRVWYIRGLSPRIWTCNLANHRFWPMGSTAYG